MMSNFTMGHTMAKSPSLVHYELSNSVLETTFASEYTEIPFKAHFDDGQMTKTKGNNTKSAYAEKF